jgi:phospholipid/cholesterol/gamma-HCH transport system substrate-binding protein
VQDERDQRQVDQTPDGAAPPPTAGARDPRARNRGPAARRRTQRTSRIAAVGLFVLMAGLLFVLGLFMIGDRRALFARHFDVYTEFARIGGIQNGAIVRVAGADAGEVTEIRVPRSPSEKFRLKLRVQEDLRGLVRTDSVASIQTDGLVGNKFIQIEAGTDAAPQAPDGFTIAGSDLFDFTDLVTQAGKTLQALNDVIGEIQASLNIALDGVTNTMGEANRIMVALEKELHTILNKGEVVVQDLGLIVKDVRAGKGTAGRLLNDTELYDRATALLDEAHGVVGRVNEAAEQAKQLVGELRTNTGPVQGAVADLRHTLSSAREAMADLSESSEALKRNFFFRGFFERRGYFDLDDIPVEQYRAGALEGRDRRVVRVWLRRDVLFATNDQGQEVLTEDGRTRLESAMSDFLKHPADSPIVVEGYAVAPTHDERYILSRRRASMAREYLVSRIQLDMTRVGVMPLGDQAPGSPGGDTWDGIAIAIFLRAER